MSTPLSIIRIGFVALIVLSMSACQNPQREAMRELNRRGIEASGSSLLAATVKGDTELAKLLLQAKVYSGQRDAAGNSPLHISIERGHLGLAWELIENGADLNSQTPKGVTPLSLAVFKGETALADQILDAGAPPTGLTPDGDKLLPWAIRNGRLAYVRRLMERGADPHQKDSEGNPLLHVAMESGRRGLAVELLKLGADAAAVNAHGESALVAAMRKSWRDLYRPLVQAGADPNLPDQYGRIPLQVVIDAGDLELAKLLADLGARPHSGSWSDALWNAINQRNLPVCRLLLGLGISPETPDGTGRRPIEVALAEDLPDFLHLFLCYGADGDSLYYEACRRKQNHHVSLLLAHGGLPRPLAAPSSDTPLGFAIRHNDRQAVSLLLDRGAALETLVSEGQTPLCLAISLGRTRIVEQLLAAGADPNEELARPVSPLFMKTVRGGTMRWILRKERKITPIMLAANCGKPAIARALIAAGAKTSVWTQPNRMWPINIAARKNDVGMMRVLLGQDPYAEERHMLVDLSEQRAWVYDSSGSEIFSTKISSGKRGHATPTGTYAITNKYRHWTSTIYHASMPCFQRLSCSDFGFHQGNVPGYPASHGCIRVPYGKAQKLFALTRVGDRVEIRP